MRFHGLDLNLLVALNVLLEERNVTRAAERLCLSQAATSNALARLRQFFDDDLLVRVGPRMVPTDRARSLQPSLVAVLRQIEGRLMNSPTAAMQNQRRQFTVMSADAVTISLLAKVSERLEQTAPGVRLVIRPLSKTHIQDIERGTVDLKIIPGQFASPSHPKEPVYEDGFRVIYCKNSLWANQHLTAEAYLAARHVIVEIGPEQKVPVDRAIIEQAHGRLVSAMSVHSQVHVPWYVLGTDRLGTVPDSIARRFERILPLASSPLPFDIPPNQIVMQWNAQQDQDAGLAWLRGEIRQVGADLLSLSG